VINKRLDAIGEHDLQNLVTNGVGESNQLDYKETLPGGDDGSRKEFLRDVSAMANANGGDLIYGVREQSIGDTNAAAEVVGVEGVDVDARKLWMEDLIRTGIEPRLLGVGVHVVPVDDSKVVFVVRVPRSWNAPHAVNFKGHWRFYSRHSAGNYPMDVTQLRDAVLSGATLTQRLEEFRLNRLAKVMADPALEPHAKIVIHLQPLDSVRPEFKVDVTKAVYERELLRTMTFEGSNPETRLNFDGVLAYHEKSEGIGYVQVFRNGVIETVDARILDLERDGKPYVPARSFEMRSINAVYRRLLLLKQLGITSPVMLHMSLLGVKNYRLFLRDEFYAGNRDYSSFVMEAERHPIDRDDLLLRGELIEDFQGEHLTGKNEHGVPLLLPHAGRILRPVFDTVWNAAGFSRSLHYNANGEWTGQLQ
jgi:hypothetical protein